MVVAGAAQVPAERRRIPPVAVARFNADGSIDGSFGDGGGRVYGFGRITYANGVAIDGDGRIVLAGSQRDNLQTTNVLVARLLPNGGLDPTFSATPERSATSGSRACSSRTTRATPAMRRPSTSRSTPANRPVIAGAATNGSADPQGAARSRAADAPPGSPTASFSGDGIAYLRRDLDKDQFNKQEPFPGAAGVVLGGNDVILAGYFDNQTPEALAVWALTAGGSTRSRLRRTGGARSTARGQHQAIAIAANGDLFGVGDTADLVSAAFRAGGEVRRRRAAATAARADHRSPPAAARARSGQSRMPRRGGDPGRHVPAPTCSAAPPDPM